MSKDKAIFCIERGADYEDYTYLVEPIEPITMAEYVQIGKELQLKKLLTGDRDGEKTHPG